LTKRCYIPHVSRQLALKTTTNQVKTVILQQHQQVHFHKQAYKVNPEARIRCRSRNKCIIINQIN